jgi:hypothetical protein
MTIRIILSIYICHIKQLILVSGPLHRICRHWSHRRRGCWYRLDSDGGYAVAFHFFYYEAAAFVIEGFASGGHFLKARKQEAG